MQLWPWGQSTNVWHSFPSIGSMTKIKVTKRVNVNLNIFSSSLSLPLSLNKKASVKFSNIWMCVTVLTISFCIQNEWTLTQVFLLSLLLLSFQSIRKLLFMDSLPQRSRFFHKMREKGTRDESRKMFEKNKNFLKNFPWILGEENNFPFMFSKSERERGWKKW